MKLKRKNILINLSILVIINMITNMFFPGLAIFAETNTKVNSNVQVEISCNKENIQSGETVEFTLKYDITGGPDSVKEGDFIEFQLPKEFETLKPKYPPEHFKEQIVNGNTVKLIFSKGAETAIGGYISIKAKVKDVKSETKARVEVKVNGDKNIKYMDVNISPNKNSGGNNNKPDREIYKNVDGAKGYENGNLLANIGKPAVGKTIGYSININEKGSKIHNLIVKDIMPKGSELLADSIKIYQMDNNNQRKDVTSEMKKYVSADASGFTFKLIDTQTTYRIDYKAKFTKEYDKYVNIAELSQEGKGIQRSSTIVRPIEDQKIITKTCYGDNTGKDRNGKETYVVSKVGDVITYQIDFNPNNAQMNNVTLKDEFPAGMELVDGRVNIIKKDINGQRSWETGKKINISGKKFTIDFGDTNYNYNITYQLKVTERHKEYNNNAKISYDNTSQQVSSTIDYEMNEGAINAQKLVDKTELKKGDNQEVTYTINFDCYGYFNKDNMKVVDDLDDRLKILDVQAPKEFTVKRHEGNKIEIINDKGGIEYGEKLQVKIKTDFSNIPDGTTINNVAKINKSNSNKVETKKGFKFKAKKVDANDNSKALAGAKYNLIDSSNKVIATLVSDKDGVISYDLDKVDDYYLKEIEAPKHYILDNSEKKISIKDSDIGTVVDIGKLENQLITGGVELIKEDSITEKPLQGAEFKLIDSNGKLVREGLVTDAKGEIKVIGLNIGTYKFAETKAPLGYKINSNDIEFEIKEDGSVTPEKVIVKDDIILGSVRLTKEDSESTAKLAGAEFDLYKLNDKNVLESDSSTENNSLSSEVKNLANKAVNFVKDMVTSDSTKIGTYITDKNGVVNVNNLRPGDYYFVETKAPEGYNLDATRNNFTIKLGEADKVVTVIATDIVITKKKIVVDNKGNNNSRKKDFKDKNTDTIVRNTNETSKKIMFSLPKTGQENYNAFIAILLIVAGVILLIKRKKEY